MGVVHVGRNDVLDVVTSKVEDAKVVLDLGSGICPQPFVKNPDVHICVEAHRPYLERLKNEVTNKTKYVFINARWDEFIGMLPDKSVDTVFALDFIEHLEKEDGLRMLGEAQRVARRQVVVYTPHGFFPQSYDDPDKKDRWGMDGGYWQTHRSGWDLADFGETWDFVCCPDYILLDEENQPMEEPMGAIWAFRNLTPEPNRTDATEEGRTAFQLFRTILQQGLPPIAFRGLRSAWIAFLHATHRIP